MSLKISLSWVLAPIVLIGFSGLASAGNLKDNLNKILLEHDLIKVVEGGIRAAEDQVNVEGSTFYPKISLTGSGGRQKITGASVTDTTLNTRQASLTVKQSLYDFGKSTSSVSKAEAALAKEMLEFSLQKQNLLLAGIEAHLGLKKAWTLLDSAMRSEENIKLQTKLENARIQSGQGYTTDYLQAKAQLAGAVAQRIAAESELSRSINRYQSIFGDGDVDPQELENIVIADESLPVNLEEMLIQVSKSSPDVMRASGVADVAWADVEKVRKREWAPSLDLVLDHTYKNNVDGTRKNKNDSSGLIELSWDFYTGQRASKTVSSAMNIAASERAKSDYSIKVALEKSKNAWVDLHDARERKGYLKDQVDIAGKFLELARNERELNKRSLLDVLNGETTLLLAERDYKTVKIEITLASIKLLRSIGALEPGLF